MRFSNDRTAEKGRYQEEVFLISNAAGHLLKIGRTRNKQQSGLKKQVQHHNSLHLQEGRLYLIQAKSGIASIRKLERKENAGQLLFV